MPEGNAPKTVYQLRVWLLGISPMIWRRLLVSSDSTIFDLHYILQIVFGWGDYHLNRFLIHGKQYGIAKLGGLSFRDDPRQVKLADFGLRVGEKFFYEYDFTDNWQLCVRVEAILLPDPKRAYPMCVAGKRSGPPEDCGGPMGYLELLRHHRLNPPLDELSLIADVLDRMLKATELETIRDLIGDIDEFQEAVARLEDYTSFRLDSFDRREVNRRLQQYAVKGEAWAWQ